MRHNLTVAVVKAIPKYYFKDQIVLLYPLKFFLSLPLGDQLRHQI